jgi:acyl-CoA synthetase (AMP-forming)/AMP-acid ligase II
MTVVRMTGDGIPSVSAWPTLSGLLRERSRSRPDSTAVICGEHRTKYPELDRRVDELAALLRSQGLGSGDRVLWLGKNCHLAYESIFACSRVGAALVPANWRQSTEELAWLISDLDPRLVLWQGAGELVEQVAEVREQSEAPAAWIDIDVFSEIDSFDDQVDAAPPASVGAAGDPRSAVLGIYTSAFDGRPSCAMLDDAAIAIQSVVIANAHNIDHTTIYLNCGPMFHVGTLMSTLATFMMGGVNVFVPDAEPQRVCEMIIEHGITRGFIVEPTRGRVADLVAEKGYDISSLQAWPGSDRWNAIITIDTSIWGRATGGYGQTEAMGHVSFRGLAPDAAGECGRANPIVALTILDDEGGEVAAETVGEISVRGPQIMVGYHDRDTENAGRGDPADWYRTRDLGRREADGSLTFIGPKARMLKSGVENIYPAEVERCIREHPAVADCAVIGMPDPVWTQNVVAVVVCREGQSLGEVELQEFCKLHIASYKKPKRVVFVDAVPRLGFAIDYAQLDADHGGGGYPGVATKAVR